MGEVPERILVLVVIGLCVLAVNSTQREPLTFREIAFYTLIFYNVVLPTISWEKIRMAVKKIVD